MKHLILTLLTLLSLPLTSFAGHSVNNGVDRSLRTDHAVWFADAKRPIKACLEVAEDFGVDARTAETTIKRAFATWEEYLVAKRVDKRLRPLGLGLSFELELDGPCRGDEDLTFYLGGTNPEVKEASADFSNPLGFARRTSYDEKALWGKGLIWITAPAAFAKFNLNWNLEDRLLGILLHEVGHVYGCGHVRGTIMRADLSNAILDGALGRWNTFAQIDSGRQLIYCPECKVSYDARILINAPLEKLLGKTLKPSAEATMEMEAGSGFIKIVNGARTYEITAKVGNTLASESSDVPLLSIPATGVFGGFATSTTGLLSLLTLRFEGREALVAYRRNMQFTVTPKRGFMDELLVLDTSVKSNVFLRLDPKTNSTR